MDGELNGQDEKSAEGRMGIDIVNIMCYLKIGESF
jgi:hypothetical protein